MAYYTFGTIKVKKRPLPIQTACCYIFRYWYWPSVMPSQSWLDFWCVLWLFSLVTHLLDGWCLDHMIPRWEVTTYQLSLVRYVYNLPTMQLSGIPRLGIPESWIAEYLETRSIAMTPKHQEFCFFIVTCLIYVLL